MKATILDVEGKESGKIELPEQFNEVYRPDLISRAVIAIESNNRQPYGSDVMAGKRAAATLSKRRRDYKSCYGHGISRAPRKIMSGRGERLNWVGAFAPGTVKGRKAHPPKAEKNWKKKINKRENRKAIRSALNASVNKDLVSQRGHIVPKNYPIVIDTSFETISKTQEIVNKLEKMGLESELKRICGKHIRAGKGKLRGRRYKNKTGPLLVVGDHKCALRKAAQNILGVDIITINSLNAKYLAPGTKAGRLTLFTKNAIEKLEKEKLFVG